MNEISISNYDLSKMCRLCLSRDLALIDIFSFSTKMRNEVSNIIMKCTPVQITKGDKMPKCICQLCNTQLEKIYKFQMVVVQSEKTLRQYLQQLHIFDKEITPKPNEEHFIHNYIADTKVKCESFEFLHAEKTDKELANFTTKEEISLTSIIKDEPTDYNYLTLTECPDNSYEHSKIDVKDSKFVENIDNDWKDNEYTNVNVNWQNNEELSPKSEIKDESGFTESVENTENTLFECNNRETSCTNTTIDVDHASENLTNLHSVDARNMLDKSDETNKNISVNSLNHKKTSEMDSKCDKPYQCDVCNKCFSQAGNLNNHKRIHTGEKPYQCDICQRCFSHSNNLHYHKRSHTGEKPYQCDVCNKCFSQSSNLNNHKRIHTGEKPYRCDVCNTSFYDSSVLIRHKRTHTGDKPYQCDVCKKCFSQASNLNNHKRIHTGEKPYQCDVCKASFYDSSILIRHKRIHTGEKPYLCDICNKCFSKSDHLRIHKRIHTGEKPYQCDVCNKCFGNSSTLKRHLRVHTSAKTIS